MKPIQIKRKERENNHCIDCGKLIWKYRKKSIPILKCKTCSNKFAHNNLNQNNGQWKGNTVGYDSIHQWVKRHKPKTKFCECCKIKPPHDLANISKQYKRDTNDYTWLCKKCHHHLDWVLDKEKLGSATKLINKKIGVRK
jgi:hypothetical protein